MALKETQAREAMPRQTLMSQREQEKQLAKECAAVAGRASLEAAPRRLHPTEEAVGQLWGALSTLSSQLDALENTLRPYLSITDPGDTRPEVPSEVPQSEIHGALLEMYQDVLRKIGRVDYLAQSIR